MRTITVFLASSEELMNDRNYLHALIASLDELYEPRGIRIRCRRWEFFSAYYSGNRTQDDYNKIVRSSDMCICMFHKKAGEYTIEEFHQALDEFQSNKNHPKTFVYIRSLVEGDIETEELKQFKKDLFRGLGHYWCNYANNDTMKLHFVMQLERLINAEGTASQSVDQLKVNNGIVSLQGRKVAELKNLSFASSNSEYQSLKEKYAQLDKDITQLRAIGIDEGQDFLRSKVIERAKCREEIQKYESQMLDMALFVNGIISSGNVISERKRLAIEMFEQGNIKGVIDVLNEDDMALEARQAEQNIALGHSLEQQGHDLISNGLQTIRSQVEEYHLRANALMLNLDEPERFEMACQAYENAIALSKKNLPPEEQFKSLKEYAIFLQANKQYEKWEQVSNKMSCLLQQSKECAWNTYPQDKGFFYFTLGSLYYTTNRFDESEVMYMSALEICKQLATENPQAYEPDLASSYGNLGVLYSDTNRLVESEEMYMSALEIRKRLAAENPRAYESDLAVSYVSLGSLYLDNNRLAESEEMYVAAKKVYKQLAKDNPDLYETAFSWVLLGLGWLYILTRRYAESEIMCESALKVSPGNHYPYTNLAAALLFQGKVGEAEKIYRQYRTEFKTEFLNDFADFERAEVIPEERIADVERIKSMLNEE